MPRQTHSCTRRGAQQLRRADLAMEDGRATNPSRRRLRRPPTEIHDLGGDVLSSAFPAVASGATDGEIRREVAAERARFNCKACKRNVRADSHMHSRDPAECRYPHSVPIHWECPGCKEEKECDHPMHTNKFGKCRFAGPHARPRPRAGQHPRAPAVPGGPHPSSDQQAQLPGGADLGAADEAAIAPAPAGESGASSSSSAQPSGDPAAEAQGIWHWRPRRGATTPKSGTTSQSRCRRHASTGSAAGSRRVGWKPHAV